MEERIREIKELAEFNVGIDRSKLIFNDIDELINHVISRGQEVKVRFHKRTELDGVKIDRCVYGCSFEDITSSELRELLLMGNVVPYNSEIIINIIL